MYSLLKVHADLPRSTMSSSERTASQARQSNIELMGSELGSVYSDLWQQVAWLHVKWREFTALYGSKPERIQVLNESAPAFFRLLQETLWEDVLLHIARLTDPAQVRGKANLSVQRLPQLISDGDVSASVSSSVALAVDAARFCRDWRNRHIAHRDLNLALGRGATPLEVATRSKVQQALTALADVLNAVAKPYLDTTTRFDLGPNPGDAESLIYVIDAGLRAEAERSKRLKSGEVLPEDLSPRQI